jgi:hypothetical protein
MPRFVVFQRPPNAEATYQTLVFRGSIATSWMRPDVNAGPMERSSMSLRVGARPAPLEGAALPCPHRAAVIARAAASADTQVLGTGRIALIISAGCASGELKLSEVRSGAPTLPGCAL